MLSYWSVYSTLNLLTFYNLVIKGIAHTVQTLEFETVFIVTGQFNDYRCRVSIMRGKLRIHGIAVGQ